MGSIFGFDAISARSNPYTPSVVSTPAFPNSPNNNPTSSTATRLENLFLTQMSCPSSVTDSKITHKSSSSENSINESIDTLNCKMSSTLPFTTISQLEFDVSHFFTFGSLLSLLLELRKNGNHPSKFKLMMKILGS